MADGQTEYDRAIHRLEQRDGWGRDIDRYIWLLFPSLALLVSAYLSGWWVGLWCLLASLIVILLAMAIEKLCCRWSRRRRERRVRSQIIRSLSKEDRCLAEEHMWRVIRDFVRQHEAALLELLSTSGTEEVTLVGSEWGNDRVYLRLSTAVHDCLVVYCCRDRFIWNERLLVRRLVDPPRYYEDFLYLLPDQMLAITVASIYDTVWPSDVPDTALSQVRLDGAMADRGLSPADDIPVVQTE